MQNLIIYLAGAAAGFVIGHILTVRSLRDPIQLPEPKTLCACCLRPEAACRLSFSAVNSASSALSAVK